MLENESLVSESRKASIAYEALSYASGDHKNTEPIQLNGSRSQVFGNLFLALSQLRFPDKERLLWVDQLCINQIDIPERNSSVLLLCDIYRQATSTVVWLGPAKEGTIEAVHFVNEFIDQYGEDIRQHLLRWAQGGSYDYARDALKEQRQFRDDVVDFLVTQDFWSAKRSTYMDYNADNSRVRNDPVAKAIHWKKNALEDVNKKTIFESETRCSRGAGGRASGPYKKQLFPRCSCCNADQAVFGGMTSACLNRS